MPYQYTTCYFHSGTGNSYMAARWLVQEAEKRGSASALIPIGSARPAEELKPGPDQLVGVYHPTHGLMPSWSMIKFLFALPRGKGAHALIAPTRGALPVGRLVIPGAAGLALFLPLLILLLKGYRVRGGLGIDLPANMLNLHWGFKKENVDRLVARGQRSHQRLAGRVLSGKTYWHPLNLLWELLWCFPFLIWPLFPLLYLLVGRVFMAKLMFSDTSCVGCGRCARNCPSQAIQMLGAKPKTPFWTLDCEVCLRCMGYCKFQAVQASHLWMAPVIFITSFLGASSLQEAALHVFGLQSTLWQPAYEMGAILLTFVCLPLLYYAFWGMQRWHPLRIFFSYATLTRYYPRRYHAPGVSPRQMNRREYAATKAPDYPADESVV
jgi:ferredoxin